MNLVRLEAIAFWLPKRSGGIMDPWNDHHFPLHQGMTFGSHRIESSSLISQESQLTDQT